MRYNGGWMTSAKKMAEFHGTRARAVHLLVLMLSLFVPSAVGAQQTLELPMPRSQSTQPLRPRVRPPASPVPSENSVRTIPQAPLPAAQPQAPPPQPPPAQPQSQPVLPAVFRGCWQGVVDGVDRIVRLPGAPKLGVVWTPKTYMLCYRRVGNGPFQLTFTDTGVGSQGLPGRAARIINARGQLQLVSTDGRSYARMRAYLHFDEFRVPAGFGNPTFPVDEVTDLDCTIEADGMHAVGVVYGERSGAPWFRAWWHTTFFHVRNLSE